MAKNKTQPNDASVEDYLAARGNPQQQADCRRLIAMFERLTGHNPTMWGPSIVGHGQYRYSYESGRSDEAPLAAFAIRGRDLVIYLKPDAPGQAQLLSRLGKHRMGKSCLYFRTLADLDVAVLEQLVRDSIPAGGR